jgi:hypothetical protein
MAISLIRRNEPINTTQLVGAGLPRPLFRLVLQYAGDAAALDTHLDKTENEEAYKYVFDLYNGQKLVSRFKVTGITDALDFRTKVAKIYNTVLDFMNESMTPALGNVPNLLAPVVIGEKLCQIEINEALADAEYFELYEQQQESDDSLREFDPYMIPVC